MLPSDFLPTLRGTVDNLWSAAGVAIVTAAVTWGWALYKRLSAVWQWGSFTILESLIGLTGVGLSLRYGLTAAVPSIIAVLVPVGIFLVVERHMAGEDVGAQRAPNVRIPGRLKGNQPELILGDISGPISALPLALQEGAFRESYVGARVYLVGSPRGVQLLPDGRYELRIAYGPPTEMVVAIVEKTPLLFHLHGENIRVAGVISAASTATAIVLDPAECSSL